MSDQPVFVAEMMRQSICGRGMRMRIAMTAEEFEEYRQHCLQHEGWSADYFRGIPIVIDEIDRKPRVEILLAAA